MIDMRLIRCIRTRPLNVSHLSPFAVARDCDLKNLHAAAEAAQQDRGQLPLSSGAEGAQAGAVPASTRGIPGTGNPSDTEHDPRVVFSNVSQEPFLSFTLSLN